MPSNRAVSISPAFAGGIWSIQKVIRKINLDSNYYEDLQSEYDADSDELAVLENQLNSEEGFLKMLRNYLSMLED